MCTADVLFSASVLSSSLLYNLQELSFSLVHITIPTLRDQSIQIFLGRFDLRFTRFSVFRRKDAIGVEIQCSPQFERDLPRFNPEVDELFEGDSPVSRFYLILE